jgi:BlaI family penicillinase repressor
MRLGAMQTRIMRVLWERGQANAKEITSALNEAGGDEVAHSTVQTLLRQLEGKGAVQHEVEGRTWIFVPAIEQAEARTHAARELLGRAFHNSLSGLVAHLLEHEKVSPQEMERLREVIAQHEAAPAARLEDEEARHD